MLKGLGSSLGTNIYTSQFNKFCDEDGDRVVPHISHGGQLDLECVFGLRGNTVIVHVS